MTNTQKLINEELSAQGLTFKSLVKYHRKHGRTWSEVADRVSDSVGITVSRESLRKWFG